jgi:L-threonylcarbamoyladenylate synthase
MGETELLGADDVARAAAFLKAGRLVAFPTETVYGLGACLFNPQAIQAIFTVKGRPSDNPLIAHVSSLEQVEEIAEEIPPAFYQLAKRFFPGPLAIILKRRSCVPSIASAGLDSIAIRMPSHPVALKLIESVGEPLVAPSANLSGRPSSTESKHVLEDFAGKIAAVIDGGKTEVGFESTVISLLGGHSTLFRPGKVTKEEIEEELAATLQMPSQGSPVLSPGMKYRHYAPRAPIHVFRSAGALRTYLAEPTPFSSRMLLTAQPVASSAPGVKQFILSPQEFYSLLRLADEMHYEEILVLCDQDLCKNVAFMDRLMRASGAFSMASTAEVTE